MYIQQISILMKFQSKARNYFNTIYNQAFGMIYFSDLHVDLLNLNLFISFIIYIMYYDMNRIEQHVPMNVLFFIQCANDYTQNCIL